MSAQSFSLPTPSDLDQLFRQKYGDPATVGWSPRQRYEFGYYLPADVYEATVKKLVFEGCEWIDIGGGHNVFPENPGLARILVDRCRSVVAVDPSENVHRNTFVTTRAQCLVEEYRTDQRFDLATMRMVVEHVTHPQAVSAALARLLKPGGVLLILTVNKHSPLTLISRLVPFRWHYPIKRLFWSSAAEDTFEVEYRMNSRGTLRKCLGEAGLDEVLFAYLDDLSTWSRFRRMSYVESLARMMFNRLGLTYPENCLLAVYQKR
jgi:SAM-dependent methyltransferase